MSETGGLTVAVDDDGIAVRDASETRHVAWDDLAGVAIQTRMAGSDAELLWVLERLDGTSLVIPAASATSADLLPRLKELPGFDVEPLVRAAAATTDDLIVCWRRQ
jgi:hypothetical protein